MTCNQYVPIAKVKIVITKNGQIVIFAVDVDGNGKEKKIQTRKRLIKNKVSLFRSKSHLIFSRS